MKVMLQVVVITVEEMSMPGEAVMVEEMVIVQEVVSCAMVLLGDGT